MFKCEFFYLFKQKDTHKYTALKSALLDMKIWTSGYSAGSLIEVKICDKSIVINLLFTQKLLIKCVYKYSRL